MELMERRLKATLKSLLAGSGALIAGWGSLTLGSGAASGMPLLVEGWGSLLWSSIFLNSSSNLWWFSPKMRRWMEITAALWATPLEEMYSALDAMDLWPAILREVHVWDPAINSSLKHGLARMLMADYLSPLVPTPAALRAFVKRFSRVCTLYTHYNGFPSSLTNIPKPFSGKIQDSRLLAVEEEGCFRRSLFRRGQRLPPYVLQDWSDETSVRILVVREDTGFEESLIPRELLPCLWSTSPYTRSTMECHDHIPISNLMNFISCPQSHPCSLGKAMYTHITNDFGVSRPIVPFPMPNSSVWVLLTFWH